MPEAKKRQLQILKALLPYLRRYAAYVLLSFFFAAASAVAALYVPILTGRAVDCIVGPLQVDFEGIFAVLKQMAAVVLITAAAQWLMNVCNNKIAFQIVRDLRMDLFAKIEALPLKFLDAHSHGELVSRMIADADQVSDGLLMGFTQLFTGVITIIGTLLFMFGIQYQIALVVVCITPVSFLVAAFIARRTFSMFQLQSQTRGEQTALVEEMIANQKVVQAYGREEAVQRQFAAVNARLLDCSLKATFFSSLTNPCTRFVNSLVYTGAGIFGALFAASGGISVGQLASFLSYANQYTKPFNEISGVVTELQNAIACAGRIFDLLQEETQTPEEADAVCLTDADGAVSLEHVDFSYIKEQPLIEDFNLSVLPGQRTAIVGPTGCGKTTLINLLMRFYDVDGGCIRVDGEDVRHLTRESLRRSYGMVLQETWLREGTILSNIRMGHPDASEEDVKKAAKAAHAHGFIKRLPLGYDTVITEAGGGLSQGQKQLLCIARVMLSLPPMLILDEATSSIDTRTEQKIQNAFAKMMQGRTSFIVAHRLSTIKEADRILVMKDGRILEQGNHNSLLAKNGFYATLYNSQFIQSDDADAL